MKAFGGNSGYIGYSESVNSLNAKREGKYPKTEFKKVWGISESKFRELADRGIIYVSEWHHTSKFGNRTNFFDISDMPLFLMVIGRKEEAYAEYLYEKYTKRSVCSSVKNSKFVDEILLKRDDPKVEVLKGLGISYTRTKRSNYSFRITDRKVLENKIVREIFKKHIM